MRTTSKYLKNGQWMSGFLHSPEGIAHRYNGSPRKLFGFTMVELMIVVAIVGLLASIAIPAFARMRSSSQMRTCISNLRQLDECKQRWGMEAKQSVDAVPTVDDIISYLRANAMPECPANGNYRLRRVAYTPVCSLYDTGHTLNTESSADDALPD